MKFKYKIDGRGMPEYDMLQSIEKSRNISDTFLSPKDTNMIPCEKLKNIEKAYNMLYKHKALGSRITIMADVDCDGATSCAIIYRYLRKSGFNNVSYIINDQKKHGILTMSNCDEITKNTDLLIIVDSIDKFEEYSTILSGGIDIICLDHHILPSDAKDYDKYNFALVSSANEYENSELSGAGVCLKFCIYIDKMNLTNYADNLYDLAACGIIADVCSMSSMENRYIVQAGLNNPTNIALKKIVGGYEFNSTAVAYSVAPLINACVRTGRNRLAVDMFVSDNEDYINEIIKEAKTAKEEQNEIVEYIMIEAEKQANEQKDNKVLFVKIPQNNSGFSGMVANKLMSSFRKTAFVVTDSTDGVYKGSMRGTGVKDVMEIVNNSGYALCEGHELASGFSCNVNDVDSFISYMNDVMPDIDAADDEFCADIFINPKQLTDSFIRNIKIMNRISGKNFDKITVMVESKNIEVSNMSKGKHLKVIDKDTGTIFVKWNDPSYLDRLEDKIIIACGTPDTAFYGKTKYREIIMENYETYRGE